MTENEMKIKNNKIVLESLSLKESNSKTCQIYANMTNS